MAIQGAIAQRTGLLWVPDDTLDLLAVSVDGDSPRSLSDGMVAINTKGRQWLNGDINAMEYLDMLEFYGIANPYEHLDEFCQHIDLIMSLDY